VRGLLLQKQENIMDRRAFLANGGTAGIAVAAGGLLQTSANTPAMAQGSGPPYGGAPPLEVQKVYAQQQQFRIGYTTNTRGGWEGDPFVGMAEAREVGFRYVEIFGTVISAPEGGAGPAPGVPRSPPKPNKVWPDGYVYTPPTGPRLARENYYPDRWEALQHRVYEIGVQFACINGGAAGAPADFAIVEQRQAVIDNHVNMARFSRRFGCEHQKTNCGPRRQINGRGVDVTPLEDLKNIAITVEQIGKRCTEELGIKFGVHAHLSAQIATEPEINYLMENTNPEHVYFVLDTSMVNMAGMDPVALAKKLGNRICEFHLKDNAKNTRGGAKPLLVDMPEDYFNNPISYPLGEGGVDFPALIDHLRTSNWRGHLVVELETSPWRPAKESARITANYIRNVLKIEL
jgi:sugar phosphate isomerase/epimerase